MVARYRILAGLLASLAAAPAVAQTDVNLGFSGWTGFAPLTLAKEAGIFEKHGLNVTLSKIPQASRHLAMASGDIQCAATTVETWVAWSANGVPATQIFQMDKSYGADGIAVRGDIADAALVVYDAHVHSEIVTAYVPQAAEGLLEVRLDLLAEVAVPVVAGAHGLDELRQPGAGPRAPVVGDGGADPRDELLVAGDEGEVEQADRR